MIRALRDPARSHRIWTWPVAVAVLALAFILGQRASMRWVELLIAGAGGLLLLAQPILGLPVLVLLALAVPIEFGTGSEVKLNPATLLVPVLCIVWALHEAARGRLRLAPSRTNLPLFLFVMSGLLSLGVGAVIWDPAVPRSANFTLVQLAQWAVFAFSALAFWLAASLIRDEAWLRRLTWAFLAVAGAGALLRLAPGLDRLASRVETIAFMRAPLWVLLAGLAGGQLLFNRRIAGTWRILLVVILGAVLLYAFVQQQESASNWVGVAAVAATLVWLRFPRLRWPIVALVTILAIAGVLFPTVYNFAGGDAEWTISGGSRMALAGRVISVTMRNPITGLGPAAYRPYARMEPLPYQNAYWLDPQVSSHNNYVDIFSHTGLVGLGLFGWFVVELTVLGLRLHRRHSEGFSAGYVNGMLATGAGALAIMLLADWILPFVYNIGFPGFQASVLVWLFMGGLVALENMPQRVESTERGGRETIP